MSKIYRLAAFAILAFATCSPAMAAADESDIDARVVGYQQKFTIETPASGTAWLMLVGLGLVCCGPLFLNARRTHLD